MALKKKNGFVVQYAGEKAVPQVVVDSVRKFCKARGLLFERIMRELQYDGLNGCYYFTFANMYVGVEEQDGYIHT